MTVTVSTPETDFLCDIGDMLRLFLGDVQVVEAAHGADYAHRVERCGETVADIWRCGEKTARMERPAPVGRRRRWTPFSDARNRALQREV